MPKRVNDEVRIMNWFQTAPLPAVRTIHALVTEVLRHRQRTEEPSQPRTAPVAPAKRERKSKVPAAVPALVRVDGQLPDAQPTPPGAA